MTNYETEFQRTERTPAGNNVEIDNSLHKVGYCVSTHVSIN